MAGAATAVGFGTINMKTALHTLGEILAILLILACGALLLAL